MNPNTLRSSLYILLGNLYGKSFKWRLDGSANLLVQRVNTSVNDLDIATDERGFEWFKEYFENDGAVAYNQIIKSNVINVKYNEVEIEINCYDDLDLRMFESISLQEWEGLTVPVLPLPQAALFYHKIGRTAKVNLIKSSPEYLKQKNMSTISKETYAKSKFEIIASRMDDIVKGTSRIKRAKVKTETLLLISELVSDLVMDDISYNAKMRTILKLNPDYLK